MRVTGGHFVQIIQQDSRGMADVSGCGNNFMLILTAVNAPENRRLAAM